MVIKPLYERIRKTLEKHGLPYGPYINYMDKQKVTDLPDGPQMVATQNYFRQHLVDLGARGRQYLELLTVLQHTTTPDDWLMLFESEFLPRYIELYKSLS